MKSIFSMNFKLLYRESGEVLSQKGNRLKLIEATMVCATVFLIYRLFFMLYSGLVLPNVDMETDPWRAVFWELGFGSFIVLFTLFFTLPLLSGLLGMAKDMEDGQDCPLAALFGGFSSPKRYRQALAISFSVLWRVGVLILFESIIFTLFDLYTEEPGLKLLCSGIMFIGVIVWIFLASFGFFKVYQLSKGIKRKAPERRRMRPYALSFSLFYWLRFLPWLLLSVASFGILLLGDTLPRMLIAYFRLCRKLKEKTQSEELEL